MTDYWPPLDEQLFLLGRVQGMDRLFDLRNFAHTDAGTAAAVLDAGAEFVRGVLAPIGPVGDEHGCRLENGRVVTPPGFADAYRAYAAGGWAGLDMPLAFGGQQLPLSLQVAFAEMVNGASVPFGMITLMLRAGAWLLLEHADGELRDRTVPALARGECTATICMTEAEAGSDVGRVRTLAAPTGDGRYALSGSKIFISFGDHDCAERIVHLVLARTPDAAPGTRGLSLFAVPSRHFEDGTANAVSVSRIEHKMGLMASPTCQLDFDGAIAYRVGEEGQGLKCMFTMVNLMRLEVAMQGVALAEAATQRAESYAAGRRQGGAPDAAPVTIDAHADVQRMLLTMRARTQAMRALVIFTASLLDLAAASQEERTRARSRALAELLLPVCKTGGAEMAFEVASMAVQVFGGHGYIRDNGVERILRDSRVMAIYEGTSGIQALDLLTRKVLRDDGARYTALREAMLADITASRSDPALSGLATATSAALDRLDACTRLLGECAKHRQRDVEWAATDYLQMTALVAGAWMWLRMAAAAHSGSEADGRRRQLARFYMAWLLPQIGVHETRIGVGDPVEQCAETDCSIRI